MTIQSISGGILLPTNLNFYQAPQLTNSGELWSTLTTKLAIVCRVPKTGTLDKFEVRLGNVFTSQALKFSFQDVSLTTGFPDETIDQYRVESGAFSSNAWVAPGLITSDGTDSGSKRSVTRGDLLACLVEWNSTTGDIYFLGPNTDGMFAAIVGGYPRSVAKTSGTWGNANSPLAWALKYNDGSYVYLSPAIQPFKAINTQTFNSGSTPDERGMYFKLPWTASVLGAWARLDLSGDLDFVLYDSNGTSVLATSSMDKDLRATSASGYMTFFGSNVTLTADTFYRLVIKPTSATNVSVYDFDVNDAAMLDACDLGQNCYHTQRTDAGSWSQTTTKRPFMGLIINGIDVAAAGGGNTYSRGRMVNI